MSRRTKKTRYSFPPIENLLFGNLDSRSQHRDWSEGWPEEWDYVAASRCMECGEVVFGVQVGDDLIHRDVDRRSACGGVVEGAPGPAMNYLWPLATGCTGSAQEAAAAIVDMPLCVVTDGNGEVEGLALTGGGMDLSWSIAEAYMWLGYLPPLVIELPRMADSFDERKKWIIAGMRRSIEEKKDVLERSLKDLDRTLLDGQERERAQWRAGAPRRATSAHGHCEKSRTCIEHAADPRVPSCKRRGKGRRTP